MIMRLAAATALGILLAGTAIAQSPAPADPQPSAAPVAAGAAAPASVDECIAQAAALGQLAESKTITETKLEKLDELFSRLEMLCDGNKLTEAAAVATDIKAVLDGQ